MSHVWGASADSGSQKASGRGVTYSGVGGVVQAFMHGASGGGVMYSGMGGVVQASKGRA